MSLTVSADSHFSLYFSEQYHTPTSFEPLLASHRIPFYPKTTDSYHVCVSLARVDVCLMRVSVRVRVSACVCVVLVARRRGEYFMFLTECALPFLSQAAERFDGLSLLYW